MLLVFFVAFVGTYRKELRCHTTLKRCLLTLLIGALLHKTFQNRKIKLWMQYCSLNEARQSNYEVDTFSMLF